MHLVADISMKGHTEYYSNPSTHYHIYLLCSNEYSIFKKMNGSSLVVSPCALVSSGAFSAQIWCGVP